MQDSISNRLGKDENILADTENNTIKIIIEGDAERIKVANFLDSAEYQNLCNENCTISFEGSALIIQGTLLALTHAATYLHTSNNYISEEKSTSLIHELNYREIKKRRQHVSELKDNLRLIGIPSFSRDSFFHPKSYTTKYSPSPIMSRKEPT
jgi:hypothetical protein